MTKSSKFQTQTIRIFGLELLPLSIYLTARLLPSSIIGVQIWDSAQGELTLSEIGEEIGQ
jgi:hypothetical protein